MVIMNHTDQIKRLNKIEGQVRGIKKMIEEERYCVDILSQMKAIQSALRKVEMNILENHLRHCLKEALMQSDQSEEIQEKINEITTLLRYR